MTLNFSSIKTTNQLYNELAFKFDFPDFFGRKIDAVIDFMFGFRYSDEGMTKIDISESGYFSLNTKKFSSADEKVREAIIFITGFVNSKYKFKRLEPVIFNKSSPGNNPSHTNNVHISIEIAYYFPWMK
ncbi:barstar family protein [Brenneria sp. 4F2]|nr:barstar family protein [Brenneria bubanii]